MKENKSLQRDVYRDRLEPEDAQEALEHVQDFLKQQNVLQQLMLKSESVDALNVDSDVFEQASLRTLREFLVSLHPADIAFILESLPKKERQIIWRLVPSEQDGEILLEVSEGVRESIISLMNRSELLAATAGLDADEIAELASDFPADVVAEVQKGLTPEERARMIAVMSYPEDSVGEIMDFEMVKVRDDVTVEVVLRYLRRLPELPDHTDQLFVIDRQECLQGCLTINALLVSELDTLIADIMKTDILTLNPLDDADEAANAFERYDLVSAPVIDHLGRLVGRVTIDEVVDVIREASDEQNLSKAGLQEEDIFSPIMDSIRNRAPWLLVNLCTASVASLVASRFEHTVEEIVILAFLMSIVAGIGGNTGNQTMTMIIRALATGRVSSANLMGLIKHEFIISSLVGLGGGVIAAGFAWIISGRFTLGLVMMAAMVCNMLLGAGVGILVPFVRARFGKDPAIGSSVLLTFATDTLGFLIFLGLATIFLL